jgi:hypothetical protein
VLESLADQQIPREGEMKRFRAEGDFLLRALVNLVSFNRSQIHQLERDLTEFQKLTEQHELPREVRKAMHQMMRRRIGNGLSENQLRERLDKLTQLRTLPEDRTKFPSRVVETSAGNEYHPWYGAPVTKKIFMDPISVAIVAAIGAGALGGVKETSTKAVVDGYNGLKSLISKKFGKSSEIVDAIGKLETKPESPGRRQILAEELKARKVLEDHELLRASESLLELIRSLPDGDQHIQSAHGVGIAQADRGSSASVNLGGS